MTIRPDTGPELTAPEMAGPAGRKPVKRPFTIRGFLWENFRLFTMIGITGTMISLIPNMGTRVLGMSWITGSDNYLPLFLSIIIFFGSLFLTLCFLMIFDLIFEGRKDEGAVHRFHAFSRSLLTWYEGDLQRVILLFCLVPMWIGLVMFFILLMPLIPNRYSWLFAAVIGLTCIPLAVYSFVGWNAGKTLMKKFPLLASRPHLVPAVFSVLVVAVLILLPLVFPALFDNADSYSGDIRISADQQYFSPGISTTKGLRLEMTNLSGREVLASRHIWSADYGYFIEVIPSTGEVTILGNPADSDNSRSVYWTFPQNDPGRNMTPVKIVLRIYSRDGSREITAAPLYLTWLNRDIVCVNRTFVP